MTFFVYPHIFALSALNRMLMDFCSANLDLTEFVQLSQFPLPGYKNSPIAGLDDESSGHDMNGIDFGSDHAY
jgi:hypothetical protein